MGKKKGVSFPSAFFRLCAKIGLIMSWLARLRIKGVAGHVTNTGHLCPSAASALVGQHPGHTCLQIFHRLPLISSRVGGEAPRPSSRFVNGTPCVF